MPDLLPLVLPDGDALGPVPAAPNGAAPDSAAPAYAAPSLAAPKYATLGDGAPGDGGTGARAVRAAARIGIAADKVERLPFDLSVLIDGGIFLDVDAAGFGLLDRRLDWQALGITLPRGHTVAFRPPRCGLLPDRYRLPLLRPAARACCSPPLLLPLPPNRDPAGDAGLPLGEAPPLAGALSARQQYLR